MSISPPTFSVSVVPVSSDTLRADVTFEHVPDHFLGAAFDLVIDGPEWSLKGYESGQIFHGNNEVLELVVQRQSPQRIVFGVSLTKDLLVKVPDGKIASFMLSVPSDGSMKLHFTHGVVSIYEQGRKDIGGVRWIGTTFTSGKESSSLAETQSGTTEVTPHFLGTPQEIAFSPTQQSETPYATVFSAAGLDPVFQVYDVLTIFLALLLVGFLVTIIILKKRRKL